MTPRRPRPVRVGFFGMTGPQLGLALLFTPARDAQPERLSVERLEQMRRANVTANRLTLLVSESCVLGLPLTAADERRLRVAGATAGLIRLVHLVPCSDPAQPDAMAGLSTVPRSVLGIGFGREQFPLIAAGSFQMGNRNGDSDELPTKAVTISRPFLLQRTEVTQSQWRQVMRGTSLANPSRFIACGERCPVEQISWNDIQTFLKRLNDQDPGKSYRLPTEAEWVHAVHAGTSGAGGNASELDAVARYNGNSGRQTHPVAQKAPNRWGLYDTIGNVWEWVLDWYAATYDGAAPGADPSGPRSGTTRVLRGGSCFSASNDARLANRFNKSPSHRNLIIGFRLARLPKS